MGLASQDRIPSRPGGGAPARHSLYDTIGRGYGQVRHPDPLIQAQIRKALGAAESVVNVGAGTGNYEPTDRWVVAVEPASVMIAQRPPGAALTVRAAAEALPFRDLAFDAALAINTVHHWRDMAGGLRELQRVAHRQVIFVCEPEVSQQLWVIEYFPGVRSLPSEGNLDLAYLHTHLHVESVTVVPVSADCPDGFTSAYWRRPEAYLDPAVRYGMSPLAQLSRADIAQGVGRLRHDLQSGRWDARYGHLRTLAECDAGYRLVVADQTPHQDRPTEIAV